MKVTIRNVALVLGKVWIYHKVHVQVILKLFEFVGAVAEIIKVLAFSLIKTCSMYPMPVFSSKSIIREPTALFCSSSSWMKSFLRRYSTMAELIIC